MSDIRARPASRPIELKSSSSSIGLLNDDDHSVSGASASSPLQSANDVSQQPPQTQRNYASVPVVLYKRNNPILRQRDRQGDPEKLKPTKIVLPDGKISLGFPAGRSQDDGDLQVIDENEIVVFSAPGQDQANRSVVYSWLLFFLVPADFILITLIFARGSGAITGASANGAKDFAGVISYVCTVSILLLGITGVLLKDVRALSLFIVVFYIDSILNLIRVYTVLQFAHFIIQLSICQIASDFKGTQMPTWFSPTR